MEPNNIMQLHTVTTDDEKYSHVRHNQIEKQSSAKLSLLSMNEPHTTTDNIGTIETDPDSTDCTELLQKFRAGEIKVAQNRNGPEGELYNYQKTFATITKTEKPFYVSTHDKPIDTVRSRIMKSQVYYERELTNRVAEVFKKKSAEGKESIMLDVGANIGWFSLVAAAHGATKVYSFEPNLQNTVRFCESLSLNRWLHDDRSRDVVIPISKGAGNKNERKSFYQGDGISSPGSYTFKKAFSVEKEPIGELEVTMLDSFAERHGWFDSKPSIGFFKLDVERFEPEVFEGADRLLKSRLIEKIAMELKPNLSSEQQFKMVQTLFDGGYELVMHGGMTGPHKPVTKTYGAGEELAADIFNMKYEENLLFQLK